MAQDKSQLYKDTFEKQRGVSDCGVACIISIIQYYGDACHYHLVYKNSKCGFRGTSISGLQNAAKLAGYNLDAFVFNSFEEFINNVSFPCIVLIKKYIILNHFIICYKKPTEEFIAIFDPSTGFNIYETNHFLKVWKHKIALIMTKV